MTKRSARIVQVIETTLEVRGTGEEWSPLRRITQYWSLAGELLAEVDPLEDGRGELITLAPSVPTSIAGDGEHNPNGCRACASDLEN